MTHVVRPGVILLGTEQSAPSTPSAGGYLWYSSDHRLHMLGTDGLDRTAQAVLYSDRLASIQTTVNSNAEATHWTPANVPAAGLVSGVSLFRVRLVGFFDNKATSGTFTGRLKVNSTTILTVPVAVSQTGAATTTMWSVDVDVVVETTGASGVVTGYGTPSVITAAGGGRNALPQFATVSGLSLTSGVQFTWTVQMATADAANVFKTQRGNIYQMS